MEHLNSSQIFWSLILTCSVSILVLINLLAATHEVERSNEVKV